MVRYKLIIEYDGTPYHGWQRQAELASVQEEVEKAIEKLCGTYHHVQCSGRTDAGVHALAQVAHVDLEKEFEPFKICDALNFFLKDKSIVILSAEKVDSEFNARFSSKKRKYLYKILNRRPPSTIDRYRAWHIIRPLHVDNMREAAKHLLGTHDFTSFRAIRCQGPSPVKTLERLDVRVEGDFIIFETESRSFLHHQVRNMVGTLKLVGEGKWEPKDVKVALEKKDRRAGGQTAPAHGLYFVGVDY